MISWAIFFAVLSVVAAIFGFTGIAAGAAAIAKVLFWVFIAAFVLLLIGGYTAGRAVAKRL